MVWYDADELRYLVDLDVLPVNDGELVSYSAADDKFVMTAAGAGDVLADGSVPFTGEVTITNAAPALTLLDSDSADGTATLSFQATGANEIVASLQTDVAGTPTTYIELDGVTATIDLLQNTVLTGTFSDGTATLTSGAWAALTTIGATGDITTTEDVVIGDGKYIGSTTDKLAIQIASNGEVTLTDELQAGLGINIGTSQSIVGTTTMTLGAGEAIVINAAAWDISGTGTAVGIELDADNSTITNIGDEELKAGIDAAKIGADTSVSNAEFGHLDGLVADIAVTMTTAAAVIAANDPALKFNETDGQDQDWWIAIDADQGASADDNLEFGIGATALAANTTRLSLEGTAADGTMILYADDAAYLTFAVVNAGAVTISTTSDGTDRINIGDGGDRIDIASNTWDVTNGAFSGVGTIGSGAITSTGAVQCTSLVASAGDLSITDTTPIVTLTDSSSAAGTGELIFASSGAYDVIGSIKVDVSGSATEYMQIDGVSETVDFLKPIVGTDATFTGTTTVAALTQSAVAAPTWTINDSSTNADGTFDIRVNAATAKYAGVINFYVEEGDGAGADGSETEIIFLTINGSGATSTASGTIEFERIGNFEMGLSVSNGTTTAGFIDIYEDEDSANDYYVRILAPTITEGGNIDIYLPPNEGDNTDVLATDGAGNWYWTSAGAATAWHNIVDASANKAMDFTDYYTTMDFGDVDHDMFTIWATEAFGNYSVLRIEQKTGNPSDGELLSLAVADAEDHVDQLAIFNGTDESELTRLVEGGSITRTLVSTDGFAQWIFTTVEDGAGATDTDGIFEIITNTSMDADQDIFNVVKGTTTLFSVDEDGDAVATANLAGATYASDASVSDAELKYINTLSSNAQTQITNNAALVDSDDEIIAIINASPGTYIDVAAGGTGVGTFTDGGFLTGNSTGDIQVMAVLTDGQILVGDGTTEPTVVIPAAEEFIPVGWMNIVDGGADPPESTYSTDGNSREVVIATFDGAADEALTFIWEVPENVSGTTLKFKWKGIVTSATGPSGEAVAFSLDCVSVEDGAQLDFASFGATATFATEASVTEAQDDIIISAYSAAHTPTSMAAGEIMMCELIRDADGNDTYAQDFGLIGVTLKYAIDLANVTF